METVKPATLIEAVKFYADPDNALAEVADSRQPMGEGCPVPALRSRETHVPQDPPYLEML